jgi:hypothetical protein
LLAAPAAPPHIVQAVLSRARRPRHCGLGRRTSRRGKREGAKARA